MKKLKTTFIVWIAIYPAITGILLLFGDLLNTLPLIVRTLVLTVILVPAMTYILIPFWTRLLNAIKFNTMKTLKSMVVILFISSTQITISQNESIVVVPNTGQIESLTTQERQDVSEIQKKTEQWFGIWSPKEKPINFDGLSELFATEAEGLLVVDGFEGGVVILKNATSFKEKWKPLVDDTFSYYAIEPVGEIKIELDGHLAVTTFQWTTTKAILKNGASITLGQHGTHVWKKIDGEWKIIHEHLTNTK
ncbi:DUF4440 domain-containing protein [Winogradskyella sp.]|uniref:DUF4440 domain-containing protein n=1 Tax=Winogradskyella sp. TaxID=1883156 RepID=UPI00262A8A87|nr:DUF4440 domain-containing protein [Winogradskyella sp.]